jgi:hypothetical protein
MVIIPFTLSWITYNPLAQTFLARIAASYLSTRLNTVIKIDGLYITPRLDLNVNGVLALDQHNDTLLMAEEIFFDMKSIRYREQQKFFSINSASIHDAVFNLYKQGNDSVFSYDFIRDHFQTVSSDTISDTLHGATDWRASLTGLSLENVRFRYIDENRKVDKPGMDYADLDIFVSELLISDLAIHNDTFDFYIDHLQARDKCGFILDTLSGKFSLSPLFLIADGLEVITPGSKLDLDLTFQYDAWDDYIMFTDKVRMNSVIRPSELNMKDIGYFAPDLLAMDNQVRIGGMVNGRVSNLKVSDFRFAFGRDTRFLGDIRLYGLPDATETFINTSIETFTFTREDVKRFAIPGAYKTIPVPAELEVFGKMQINGQFTGFYNDFVSTATFESNLGTIYTDVSLTQNEDHSNVIYKGELKARRFHIGKFLGLDKYFGNMDLDAMVSGSGLTGNTVNINMNGSIDSLDFMGNTFNQLGIGGEIADKKFNGHLDVTDDKLKLIFDGILDFDQPKPLFDFTADIVDADLYNLNILDRDTISMLSAKLNCNFIGLNPDDLDGRVYIDSLEYLEGDNRWFMDNFALVSLKDEGARKRIMLNADFLEANISGSFTYSELPYAINNMIRREFPEWAFMGPDSVLTTPQYLDFILNLKDTRAITDIFVPGLIIEENSILRGNFDSETSNARIDATVPSLDYQGIQSDMVDVKFKSNMDLMSFDLSTDRILFKEREQEDTLQLGFENFGLGGKLDSDSLNLMMYWDDHDAIRHNKADIRAYYTFIDSVYSEFRVTRADVLINDSLWFLDTNNQIVFAKDYYAFKDFQFRGNKQKLSLQGVISRDPADSLLIDFESWRLSNFDILFRNYNFDLNGVINGYLGLNDILESPNFYSDLSIRNLEMNRVLIGDANIFSRWNDERQSIDLLSEIIYRGNVGYSEVLSLRGSYFPRVKGGELDFLLKLDNLRLAPLERFAAEYISGLRGIASGNLMIQGNVDAPLLTGHLKLMRTECRVKYLNTRYSFSHTIDFTRDAFNIKDLIVYDTLGNSAIANGSIRHKNLSDLYFDITLQPDNFTCLNTNRYQNEVFYGNGIVTGKVRFYGPANDFHIDANVSTAKGTDIVIPLNNSITITENDFVIFMNEEKEEDQFLQQYNVDIKGLSLDFSISINNTAELMIFLPSNMGNITSKGFGDIRFTINPRGQFNIYGDYNFLRGTFFFSFQNMINRRFEILQGGQISFAGNPYNADVRLKALYRQKTSLSGLGANISPELEGERVNVNTFLGLRGKLANPGIKFSIDFPNVRPEIKQTIFAILDTTDVALMNQQVLSLLLLNSFTYASASANMSASSLNIISSQLSNWLSQISNDFDIGINYIAGDELTQDELEVALSTQFFDNRLTVDGNVGVITRDNTQQQQASNIVGDVNIEYKLRPDGRIRLRAFNRSNNFNSLDYNSPYTQGLGIFFIKDFDRFGDLFRRQKKKER